MSPFFFPVAARSPLLLDQTEVRGAQKIFLGHTPSLSKGLDNRPPPPISRSGSVDPALFLMCLQHDLTKSGIIWVDFRLVSNV